jgi:hypothetical protein
MVVSTFCFRVFEIFLEFSALVSTVFDGFLLGCGVMVVSTLGFWVFEIFLEFSALVSTVCDGFLLGCGVMVSVCSWFPPSGLVGTFVTIVTSFFKECDAILRFDGRKIW